jgi:dTDP-L-rhamnose 4-epimerase
VALRLFNVFGSRQALSNPYTGVLAIFAARLLNGRPPQVFEDGLQRRDFVHVRDVARAFHLAMAAPAAAGQVLNVGSGRAYAIGEVARLLAAAIGQPELAPQITGKYRAGDIRHCFADIGQAQAVLGYRPRHPLETSLGELVDWLDGQQAEDRVGEATAELERRGLVA